MTAAKAPPPGANMYITNCIHGLDLRVHPRCYLCHPVEAAPPPARSLLCYAGDPHRYTTEGGTTFCTRCGQGPKVPW